MFNMTKPKIEQEEDYDEFDWIKALEEAEKRIDNELLGYQIVNNKIRQILHDCFGDKNETLPK